MEPSDRGDKWLLEHLVRHTVRSVLFQDPQHALAVAHKPGLPPPPEAGDTKPKATKLPVLLQSQGDVADERGSPPTRWFESVLSCPEWTGDQLATEMSAMKAYLRAQERFSDGKEALRQSYEAYALLKLFQSERSFASNGAALQPSARFLQLLHVQLMVYAKYVERATQRAARCFYEWCILFTFLLLMDFLTEDDLRPVRKLYDCFRQSRL